MTPRNLYPHDAADPYDAYARNGLRYRLVAAKLIDIAGTLDGMNVVDLGRGTGLLTRMLADRVGPNGRVTGVDASAAMLAKAKQHSSTPNIDFIHSTSEELAVTVGRPVDAVFSSAAFWQFEREATLTTLSQILRDGGKLCFNLSGGSFNFSDSGMHEPDSDGFLKQHEILAK